MENEFRKKIDVLILRRDTLQAELQKLEELKAKTEKRTADGLKAREAFHLVAQQIQQRIEQEVSGLVSSALDAVFDEPYLFGMEFIKRRNKIDCDLFLESNGERMHPADSVGGGVLNIIAFALRLVFLLMSDSRRVLFLDEPMIHLSRDLQPKAAELLSSLSHELGIQIIVSSHIPDIVSAADNVIQVG